MKIKVENLKCFDEVAKVIGVANAKRELFKALKSYEFNEISDEIKTRKCLHLAFTWSLTPQGYEFWNCVSRGVNPYAN